MNKRKALELVHLLANVRAAEFRTDPLVKKTAEAMPWQLEA